MVLHSYRLCVNVFANRRVNSLYQNVQACNLYPAAQKLTLVYSIRHVSYQPHVNESLDRKQCDVINMLGIDSEDCKQNSKIYTIHPQTLEHHGLVLLEGGFKKITAPHILKYFSLVRKDVGVLKKEKFIKPSTSVISSFLLQLKDFPPEKTNLDVIGEENMKFIDIYNSILKQFLIWRLESTESQLDYIMKTHPRIKHKSLKYISWTVDILEHNIGFSKSKILRHGYLIHSYPHNTLDTLQRVPQLCGKDIRAVFEKFPKVIMTATDTLLKSVQHLKDYKIPDEYVQRRMDIFTLGCDTLLQRLQKLFSIPEMKPFVENPRVVEFLHYQRKACERIDQLIELQRQCVSLHILTTSQPAFDRFAREGDNRTRGCDIVMYVTRRLKCDQKVVRNGLQKHPFWCSVPLTSLQETLDFILNKGYENEDILNNIQIVLYPSVLINRVLSSVASQDLVVEAQRYMQRNSNNVPNKHSLTKSCELALCLYFLEKDHHFTGNGLWIT